MKRTMQFGLLSAAALMMVACAAPQIQRSAQGEPRWFNQKLGGCGYSSAEHFGNKRMTRSTAAQAARQELAQAIKTRVQGMIRNYVAEGKAKDRTFSEERRTQVMRDITDMSLAGSRIVMTAWRGNEYYAMVCLDPETFGNAFDKMKELSQKHRAALKRRFNEGFKGLNKNIDRLRNRNR